MAFLKTGRMLPLGGVHKPQMNILPSLGKKSPCLRNYVWQRFVFSV